MNTYLDFNNFPCTSANERQALAHSLEAVLAEDFKGDIFSMLGGYQRILSDNRRREEWDGIHEKLKTLFMCGKNALVDGPM